MAPAATVAFTLPAALDLRGIILQLLPLCHSSMAGELSRTRTTQLQRCLPDRETEPCSFVRRAPVSSWATEQTFSTLPEARSSSVPCRSKRTAAPAQPGFTWGSKGHGWARQAAAHPAAAEKGPAVPREGYAQLCSRGEALTWPLAKHKEGDRTGAASNICLLQRIASSKPPSIGNNRGSSVRCVSVRNLPTAR